MQHTSWRHWLQGVFSSGKPRPRRGARRSASAQLAEVYEDRILLSASWGGGGGGGGGGGWWGGGTFGRHDHGSAQADSTSSSTPSGDHLVYTTQPTNGTAGQSFNVTVTIEDSSGNVVTSANSVIRLSINGPGRFAGDGHTMTATAVDGVATFNDLTLDRAGTYTLTAVNWHDGYTTSNSFAVSADTTQDHLVFLRSDPRRGTAGDTLKTIKVAVEDQFGNIVKSDDSTVTLSVKSGPTTTFDASTPSPETATVDNGIASLDNVILDDAGQYTLSATDSDSAITGATSHEIHIRSS
jgi:hypothetical protein